MKKMINFFRLLFNAFDRYVIMPITRFVFKISQLFGKPNKYFETWLSKSTTLLFISLFFAIVIFVVVDRKIITFSSQSAEVLKEQNITEKKLGIIGKLNDLAHERGQSLAQMALAWVYSHSEVTGVLVGASRASQVLDNIAMLGNVSFTNEELALIDTLVRDFEKC